MNNLRYTQIIWAFILGMILDNVIAGDMVAGIIFIFLLAALVLSFSLNEKDQE